MSANRRKSAPIDETLCATIYRDFIVRWETDLKNRSFTQFDGSPCQWFKSAAKIQRWDFATSVECYDFCHANTKLMRGSYIVLNTQKRNPISRTFRSFRNAFAHAQFTYDATWFELHDEGPTATNPSFGMRARILASDLAQFAEALWLSSKR